jgi:hypothetical protein
MKTRYYSIGLLILAIALGAFLVLRIKATIDDEARIKQTEAHIIKKLMLIREAEKAYQAMYGEFTANWDTLINFVEYGQFPITKRSERIIELAYGADSSVIVIDTLEIIPVKKYIFEESYNVYAANDGIFGEYFVQPGQYIVKGAKIYSMLNSFTGKMVNQIAKETGRVHDIVAKAEGDQLTKGEMLFIMTEELFDPDTDISQMPYIPFSDPPQKFEIFADRVERNRSIVNVIEVRDIASTNPLRDEENEANNRKPLRFGSRTEVTTAGNWE